MMKITRKAIWVKMMNDKVIFCKGHYINFYVNLKNTGQTILLEGLF